MKALALLVLALVGLPGAALEVRLRSEAEVVGGVARLADVAELAGDPVLVERAGAVVVQQLEDIASYRVEAADVRRALAQVVAGEDIAVSGERCLVRRASRRFARAELTAAAEDHLREWIGAGAEVAISVDRVGGDLTAAVVPERPLRLVAEPIVQRPWGEVPYRVRLLRGDEELGRSLVVLHSAAVRRQPVAMRDLPRGHVLELHDLALQEVRVSGTAAVTPPTVQDLIGRSLRNRLAAGEAVGLAQTQAPTLVESGTTVSVVYRHPRFEITGSGVAMSSGAAGDQVRVRQPDGGVARATVEAHGVVVIAQP